MTEIFECQKRYSKNKKYMTISHNIPRSHVNIISETAFQKSKRNNNHRMKQKNQLENSLFIKFAQNSQNLHK